MNYTKASGEWTQVFMNDKHWGVFFLGGGISDKLTAILLIGMYNASVVWSFLLNRDKTISYFFILLCSLTNRTLLFQSFGE
jgi:hypothetical protein